MRLFRKNPTARLRANRIYLLTILSCTLFLLCFSLISVTEQRNFGALSSLHVRLNELRVALEIESELDKMASACLSRDNIGRLTTLPMPGDSLEASKSVRDFLGALKKKYPIAQHFFISSGNHLIFPRVLKPKPLTSLAPALPSGDDRAFWELMQEGERWETRLGNPSRAAEAYQSAEQLIGRDQLRALALFRNARALEEANFRDDAKEAYQRLINSYGNQYDESQTPYILSLAAADGSRAKAFQFSTQSLHRIYRSLIAGKWELSAEQVDELLNNLERRLHLPVDTRSSDFLDQFRFARAVSRQLAAAPKSPAFEVIKHPFRYDDQPYQTYRIGMPGPGGKELTLGFSVSMSWVADILVPQFISNSQYRGIGKVAIGDYSDSSPPVSDGVPFLRFWSLAISSEGIDSTGLPGNRDLWFVGLSAFMFLCVLGLGLFLLIRVSSDIRWFEVRAEFVSGVSHEFKTPLSLIRLYSETLAEGDQDYPAEERLNYIRIIARESERMSRMIDNVLDFSRMEQGHRHPVLQEGDLGATISEAIQDYSEYLALRGFTVKSSIWPQMPPVKFNAEQVSQMILNLMDNARKYSGSSRLIRVNAWVDSNEVVVEVQDNGLGIPPEEIERIFQPFYRVSKGNEKGGCGLGLYLVDQVMKEHGGRVAVESQVNQGSRFRLIFPTGGSKKERSRKTKSHAFRNIHSEEQA